MGLMAYHCAPWGSARRDCCSRDSNARPLSSRPSCGSPRPEALFTAGGVLSRRQSEERRELSRAGECADILDVRGSRGGDYPPGGDVAKIDARKGQSRNSHEQALESAGVEASVQRSARGWIAQHFLELRIQLLRLRLKPQPVACSRGHGIRCCYAESAFRR